MPSKPPKTPVQLPERRTISLEPSGKSDKWVEFINSVFAGVGSFVEMWNTYEITIEVGIRNLLGISNIQGHILLSSLNFKAKSDIFQSLMFEHYGEETDASRMLRYINKYAERNILIHGTFWHEGYTCGFIKRNVDRKFTAKERKLTEKGEMQKRLFHLSCCIEDFQIAAGITQRMLSRYRSSIHSRIKSV